MTKNQIEYWRYKEEQRSNLAKEKEQNRTNVANEELTRNRDANVYYLGQLNAQENQRHNLAVEGETARSNLARESETLRSNLARESETARANRMGEQISLQNLEEKKRSNLASEAIARSNIALGYSQLAESSRHNLAMETEQGRSNREQERLKQQSIDDTRHANQQRMGIEHAKATETQRSNKAQERLRQEEIDIRQSGNTREWIYGGLDYITEAIDLGTSIASFVP